jgi:lipopolysaccharide export system permease protein
LRLLSRYILRQLALPFLFGLLALTGIMLLNVIGRKFGALVGKGLAWSVIGEVFLLSVPFILAMTLPLAVLVATLYTFSQLTSDNEITAMRAGGVSTVGLLRPVLLFAAVMSLTTFLFVDQVLPRSNVRLRNLYFDIGRKKPTFSLTEQVVNKIPSSEFHLRASRIDPGSGRLLSVSIYDVGLADRRRVIYADSGVMGYGPGGKDLVLRLWKGAIQEVNAKDPAAFEHTAFEVQDIRVGNVFDQLERSDAQLERGDREMNTCELLGVVDSARWESRDATIQRNRMTRDDLRLLLGLAPPAATPRPAAFGAPSLGILRPLRHARRLPREGDGDGLRGCTAGNHSGQRRRAGDPASRDIRHGDVAEGHAVRPAAHDLADRPGRVAAGARGPRGPARRALSRGGAQEVGALLRLLPVRAARCVARAAVPARWHGPRHRRRDVRVRGVLRGPHRG